MSSKNTAGIPINPKCGYEENEAKANFMKFKSQDWLFFNSVPHFNCDSQKKLKRKRIENIDSCPTKELNFFNGNDSFNQCKKFNSYLFQDK